MAHLGDPLPADAELIARSMADPEVFAVIFERHAASIHRFLWRQAPRSSIADLVSDVFLTAFRRRTAYDDSHQDARPWLFGIAVNVLRHSHRSELRRLARDDKAHHAWSVDHDDDAAASALSSMESDRILLALDSLDDGHREVLLLLAGPGFSYEEVARALDIPIGTVRSRASRGRDRLRELLALDQPVANDARLRSVPTPEGVTE
jgi:RNA polymerase sigma-70 factor (ECF subfamily)